MKPKYSLFRRGRVYYSQDRDTGQQRSLKTAERKPAERILLAMNEAVQQPALNLSLARAYLNAHDTEMINRTWQAVMEQFVTHGRESSRERSTREMRSRAFDSLRDRKLIETKSEDFLKVLREGTRSTNHYLRRLHNLAIGLGWLPWTVLHPKCWPRIIVRPKRAITWDEHSEILETEVSKERKLFYDFLWETGTSQTDAASMRASNLDLDRGLLIYSRQKLEGRQAQPAQLVIGPRLASILKQLPEQGPLFPKMLKTPANQRAAEFYRRCRILKIKGVSLHSYRYAWAERAMACGYPERFAQVALGHNSSAVHHAYARNAKVTAPSLEDFEQDMRRKLIPMAEVTPELKQAQNLATSEMEQRA